MRSEKASLIAGSLCVIFALSAMGAPAMSEGGVEASIETARDHAAIQIPETSAEGQTVAPATDSEAASEISAPASQTGDKEEGKRAKKIKEKKQPVADTSGEETTTAPPQVEPSTAQPPEPTGENVTSEGSSSEEAISVEATPTPELSIIDALKLKVQESAHDPNQYDAIANEAEALGESFMLQAAYPQALECFSLAYETRKNFVGNRHPSLLKSIYGQAEANFRSDQFESAVNWYHESLAIADEAQFDDEQEKFVNQDRSLRGIAGAYLAQDNGEAALPYSQRVYELAQRVYGKDSTQSLWSASELADSYAFRGMKDKARQFANEVFDICFKKADGEKMLKAIQNRDGNESSSEPLREPLPVRFWWPDNHGKPRAIVLCIHGMSLHAGSFSNLAEALTKSGNLVVGLDVRGFGSWMTSQGQGYLNLEGTLFDVETVIDKMQQLLPQTPVFLVGESMGGGIALRASHLYSDRLSGIIASAPAAQRFKQRSEIARVAIQLVAGIDSSMNIGKSLIKRSTQDPALKSEWQNDPLARMNISPRELIKFQAFMDGNRKYARKISTLPVLVIQGMNDRLVKPQSTLQLFNEIPSRDKKLITIASGEHLSLEVGALSPNLSKQILDWLTVRSAVVIQ